MTLLDVTSGFNLGAKECIDCIVDNCQGCIQWCKFGAVPQSLSVGIQAVFPPAGLRVYNNGDAGYPFTAPACITDPQAAVECCSVNCQTDLNGTFNLQLVSYGGNYWEECRALYERVTFWCDGVVEIGENNPHANYGYQGMPSTKFDPATSKWCGDRAVLWTEMKFWPVVPNDYRLNIDLRVRGNPPAYDPVAGALTNGCGMFTDNWIQRYVKSFGSPIQPNFQLADCYDVSGGIHESYISGFVGVMNKKYFNITVN